MSIELDKLNIFLGKKVQNFRKKMRWPLKKLAGHLNISIQQVHRYEQGVNKISASLLYELAKLWNVSISSFYEGYEEGEPGELKDDVINVVLVEDNAQDNFLVRKALEDFPKKINMHTIADGKQALEFFKSINKSNAGPIPKPDLILLDLYLSDMKSLDILKAIKRQSLLQNIPVIILTSSLNQEDIIASYQLHASGFIRKSFAFDEFKDQLQKTFLYWTGAVILPR